MSDQDNTQDSASESKPAAKPKPAVSIAKRQSNRRKVLRTFLLTGGVLGAAMSGFLPLAYAQKKRLRPPGALDEKDFLSSCIKCGQCVQVCPVEAIKLADLIDGFGVGTPFIDARAQACDFSCDAVQCILACPTGSLTYHKPAGFPVRSGAPLANKPVLLAKEKDAEPTLNLAERIGVARLTRPEACLAMQGKGFKGTARGASFDGKLRYMTVDRWKPVPVRDYKYDTEICDLCEQACPIKGAITVEKGIGKDGQPKGIPVVHEACVGCGVCEMICPTEPASIEIIPGEGWRA